jgi:hypothetical protein
MSSSRKKVIVRKFSREWLAGYLPNAGFAARGVLELLDLAGKVATAPLDEVKWVCFVRDFNSGETGNPERLLRKSFAAKPRSEGLWLRLRLTDGEIIEGLAANDLTLLDESGIFLIPPDIRSNTQRIFVPRRSVAELEVVAVISGPARKKAPATEAIPRQEDLFENPS